MSLNEFEDAQEFDQFELQQSILKNEQLFVPHPSFPRGKLYTNNITCFSYAFVKTKTLKELMICPCKFQRQLNMDFVNIIYNDLANTRTGIKYVQGKIVLVVNIIERSVTVYDGQHRVEAIKKLDDDFAQELDCDVTVYWVRTNDDKILFDLYNKINNYNSQSVEERNAQKNLQELLDANFISIFWNDSNEKNVWKGSGPRGQNKPLSIISSEETQISKSPSNKNYKWRNSLREIRHVLQIYEQELLKLYETWDKVFIFMRDFNDSMSKIDNDKKLSFFTELDYTVKEGEYANKYCFYLGVKSLERVIRNKLNIQELDF